MATRRDVFPTVQGVDDDDGDDVRLSVIIDEAQEGADHPRDYFYSSTGTDLRPILHELNKFFQSSKIFSGTGTGLSMKMVKCLLFPRKPRAHGQSPLHWAIHEGPYQEAYIRRYLTLSENDVSDQRLLERILYWFSGRWV
jgi:hypothetical protein